jgi:hypothetical protein
MIKLNKMIDHLVSIIFLLIINYLNVLNSNKLLFTDHMKIFHYIKINSDFFLLQKDLSCLVN